MLLSLKSSGMVVWITGLSASGKSTIAKKLVAKLQAEELPAVLLDGDEFREVMGNELAHDSEDRLKNAYRLSRMCSLLAKQGLLVVCATMSLFPEIWKWNRENLPGYLEVYLKVPLKDLQERDPRGLYQRVKEGKERNVIGIDLPFEEPLSADITIENNGCDLKSVDKHIIDLINAIKMRMKS